MGRPSTKPKTLKDGFYIEVRNKGSKSGVRLARDTQEELDRAITEYRKSKDVIVLGESKDGKWVNEELNKPKARRKKK